MENTEEIYHYLEDFSKRKPKVIPPELNDYLAYVARTGDPVYQWSLVKSLFKEKLLNVITDFYETTPSIEIPPYPNVDPFNYDTMKNSLLERLDSFSSAPFTVQRICELLTYPRKQYNRIDKFMRAVEKNILVVSTREPGIQRHAEPENGEPAEPIVNGSDNSDYNVDVEMQVMSWKENSEKQPTVEPQPSSSETHISVDDIEARLQAKQDSPLQGENKTTTQYESVTPPELNVTTDEQEMKPSEEPAPPVTAFEQTETKIETATLTDATEESKIDVEMKSEDTEKDPLVIPEIKVEDVEMTEQRLAQESNTPSETPLEPIVEPTAQDNESERDKEAEGGEKMEESTPVTAIEENSTDSNPKDEPEPKTMSEVLTSSEESSSSSDNTDGNSNSPKPEPRNDSQDESNSDSNQTDSSSEVESKPEPPEETKSIGDNEEAPKIQSDGYSISDVQSELPQPTAEATENSSEVTEVPEIKEKNELKEITTTEMKTEEEKTENTEVSSEN